MTTFKLLGTVVGSDGVHYPPGAVAGVDVPTDVAHAITNPGAWSYDLDSPGEAISPSWVKPGVAFDGSSWPGSVAAAVAAGWRRLKIGGSVRVTFDPAAAGFPRDQVWGSWIGPDVVAMIADSSVWSTTTAEPNTLPTPAH